MWFGIGIIGAIIWILIAFWPARVAGRKGHSFIGYFILSLFFFPLALIMAYVVQDRDLRPGPRETTPRETRFSRLGEPPVEEGPSSVVTTFFGGGAQDHDHDAATLAGG